MTFWKRDLLYSEKKIFLAYMKTHFRRETKQSWMSYRPWKCIYSPYKHRQDKAKIGIPQWWCYCPFLGTIRVDQKRSSRRSCLYKFYPLKPHFYKVKLVFTGVYIIFHISTRGGSNEYPQSMFWAEIWKISEIFIWFYFSFWGWNFLYIWIGVFKGVRSKACHKEVIGRHQQGVEKWPPEG